MNPSQVNLAHPSGLTPVSPLTEPLGLASWDFCDITVFCPGFQKGRVPSEKGTLARWTDRQKGTLARWTDRQKGTLARWTEEKGHN